MSAVREWYADFIFENEHTPFSFFGMQQSLGEFLDENWKSSKKRSSEKESAKKRRKFDSSEPAIYRKWRAYRGLIL